MATISNRCARPVPRRARSGLHPHRIGAQRRTSVSTITGRRHATSPLGSHALPRLLHTARRRGRGACGLARSPREWPATSARVDFGWPRLACGSLEVLRPGRPQHHDVYREWRIGDEPRGRLEDRKRSQTGSFGSQHVVRIDPSCADCRQPDGNQCDDRQQGGRHEKHQRIARLHAK